MANIQASMAGNLWKVLKGEGDLVEAGEEVAILESMKMEIPIQSEQAGTIKAVLKQEGEFVNEGDQLFEIE
ncbi:biotin carboxyl carrier protein of methylcrotonyl-CoA carboxylase [Geomicrobium sp. JCM 19037]|uniref:acetyl-CoA carboxylase biotin carboxyl carrier protein subunit n=1 Tax=unclassified Geomicrobium TaxID=2628951 RepID=UPI00045F4C61|nr:MULTISPECIES: acetyl-CoA carboxylase biotin carboxyl carrier protein subunit [unclassified Geomicrobium]GAK06071.1 biotin carboxyl carrier protein of methylcrotonyl-CoA carboxylase [Geomicrobium sp. JCM 19037]GAK11261.1 biotin carboxyl carrier protein of methylcrotonyl-CoA carboxylase [Geomicrobium sp. JCM 19039]